MNRLLLWVVAIMAIMSLESWSGQVVYEEKWDGPTETRTIYQRSDSKCDPYPESNCKTWTTFGNFNSIDNIVYPSTSVTGINGHINVYTYANPDGEECGCRYATGQVIPEGCWTLTAGGGGLRFSMNCVFGFYANAYGGSESMSAGFSIKANNESGYEIKDKIRISIPFSSAGSYDQPGIIVNFKGQARVRYPSGTIRWPERSLYRNLCRSKEDRTCNISQGIVYTKSELLEDYKSGIQADPECSAGGGCEVTDESFRAYVYPRFNVSISASATSSMCLGLQCSYSWLENSAVVGPIKIETYEGDSCGPDTPLGRLKANPQLYQADSRWSDRHYDHLCKKTSNGKQVYCRHDNPGLIYGGIQPQTIGEKGCALTSVAMMLNAFGISTDPNMLNEELSGIENIDQNNHGYLSLGITNWGAIEQLYSDKIKKRYISSNTGAFPPDTIDAELDKCNIPIAAKDTFTSGGQPKGDHWFVIIGEEGSTYKIYDPGFTGNTWINKAEITKTTIYKSAGGQ